MKGWCDITAIWGPFFHDELYFIYNDIDSFQTWVNKYDAFWIVSIVQTHFNYKEYCIIFDFLDPITAKFGQVCENIFFYGKRMGGS